MFIHYVQWHHCSSMAAINIDLCVYNAK